MVYQEDLREGAVRAIWVGDLRHEDALVTYLDEAFQQDFGFLLEDDGDPEFTYSFDSRRKPPDLKSPNRIRTCCVPFDQQVDARKLMERFSHPGGWIEDAVRQCHAKGIKAATVAVACDNLFYRPELCRNADAPLRFVGNIAWPEGRELWQESQRKRVVRPPFPTLIRREYGEESKFFDWSGIVHLDPWSGFATPAELSVCVTDEGALSSTKFTRQRRIGSLWGCSCADFGRFAPVPPGVRPFPKSAVDALPVATTSNLWCIGATDMQTAEETIIQKTRELCQTIVEQPEFQDIRQRIDTFMADENAKFQYQQVAEKSQLLQHKQEMGSALSNDEVMDYEKHREALVNNPVARGFIEAQQEMHEVQQTVNQYVSKTFELGRLPTEEDLNGGCGHGCGCHH